MGGIKGKESTLASHFGSPAISFVECVGEDPRSKLSIAWRGWGGCFPLTLSPFQVGVAFRTTASSQHWMAKAVWQARHRPPPYRVLGGIERLKVLF